MMILRIGRILNCSRGAPRVRLIKRLNLNHKGFTLVEILLVVTLIAIVAGLTLPNFSPTYKKFKLKKTAEDFSYLMRYAQSRAITKNRQMRLVFDGNVLKYWLEQEDKDGEIQEDELFFKRFSGRLARGFIVSESITIEMNGDAIYFYPDGKIDKRRIYICQHQRCMTVSSKEQRGFVRIFVGRVE